MSVHLFTPKADPCGLTPEADRFFANFEAECAKLHRRFPNFNAYQKVRADGSLAEWILDGPPEAKSAWVELAKGYAKFLGYRGGPIGAVQFTMDHMFGHHVESKPVPVRRESEREAVYTNSDGSKEMFRGRQRHAGEVYLSQPAEPQDMGNKGSGG